MTQVDSPSQPLPETWPLLTGGLPGTGGNIKCRPSDFCVEECPLYTPSGTGTHIYACMEKRGLSTPEAIGRIARHLGCRPRDIGYAGLKDTQALTRQWISVEHVDPESLLSLDRPGLQIREVTRHGNKLRLGHLAGNRFQIRLRDIRIPLDEAQSRATAVLAVLRERGCPNYFGPQRFGRRGDNPLLGQAILLDRREDFINCLLGCPHPADPPDVTQARRCYEAGDYEGAATLWPASAREERRILRELLRNRGNKSKAYRIADRRAKRFFVSAYQAALFNQVLARRLAQLDRLLPGDIAIKHSNGACFTVTDPTAEQTRCQRWEISPTGPMLGPRMAMPTDTAGDIEKEILATAQPALEQDPRIARDLGRGGRRALRCLAREDHITVGSDEQGDYLQLAFVLDPGCYATTLLAEVMKETPPEPQTAPQNAPPGNPTTS